MVVPVLPNEVRGAGAILPLVEHNYLYFVFMWNVQYAETMIQSVVERLIICG